MSDVRENGRNGDYTPPLVVVGELNVDLLFEQVNQLPELETERRCENFSMVLGSSSAIMASNAQALGLSTGFVGCTGSDDFGDFVTQTLRERGVDTSRIIARTDARTGATAIYTYGKQRGMITFPGAMSTLTLADIPWEYVSGAQHVHVSSLFLQEGLRPGCKDLFARAKELGASTSLDTGWDPDEEWGEDVFEMLPHVDLFFPNEDEARNIAGKGTVEDSLERLTSQGCSVVITRGSNGVVASHEGEVMRMPGVAVSPVDAVGAGDSFNAGFLSQYLKGQSFAECLRVGVLAGAFSTLKAGGTAAFERGDFEMFVEKNRPVQQ